MTTKAFNITILSLMATMIVMIVGFFVYMNYRIKADMAREEAVMRVHKQLEVPATSEDVPKSFRSGAKKVIDEQIKQADAVLQRDSRANTLSAATSAAPIVNRKKASDINSRQESILADSDVKKAQAVLEQTRAKVLTDAEAEKQIRAADAFLNQDRRK